MPRIKSAALPPEFDAHRLMSGPQVCNVTGLSYSCIVKYSKIGSMPQFVRLGGNRLAWKQSEILLYLQYGTDWKNYVSKGQCHD